MTTATASGAAQAASSPSGQVPQTAAAGTPAAPQEGDPQDEGLETPPATTTQSPALDPAVLARELRDANREAANLRKEIKKRDDAEAAARAAAMTEAEKVTAERDALKQREAEWQAEKRRLTADIEARDLGTKLGLLDYRDALALIPADQIEVDDNGRPTNLEQLFRDLVKDKPYLAAKAGAPTLPSTGAAAGTSGGPPPRLTADELEAAKLAGMTPERYHAAKSMRTVDDYRKSLPPRAT